MKNETGKSLTIDVSGLKKPSTASTVWYHVPDMFYEIIHSQGYLHMFLSIDDSDTDKGCIKKIVLPDRNFFEITFKKLSGLAGNTYIPKLSHQDSKIYNGFHSYNDQKKKKKIL